MTLSLDYLPQTAFVFFLLFARLGALVMVLPGIGDRTVPPRVRLLFALSLTFVFFPLLSSSLPQLPNALNAMISALMSEAIIGLAIGFSVRFLVSALQVGGTVIAFQTGLSFAQSVDPTQNGSSVTIAAFLSILSVTVIFAADLHHLLLVAIHDSYTLFKPGNLMPIGDFAKNAVDTLATAFRVGLQLAAPFIVFGLIFHLGIGVLSRLIPQIQIFFVAMPANILIGLILFALLLSTIMMTYLSYFENGLSPWLADR